MSFRSPTRSVYTHSQVTSHVSESKMEDYFLKNSVRLLPSNHLSTNRNIINSYDSKNDGLC